MHHRDWDQVQLDVMRSFTRIIRGPSNGKSPQGACRAPVAFSPLTATVPVCALTTGVPSLGPSRATQCKHLERLIHSCLTRHPWLHYYQVRERVSAQRLTRRAMPRPTHRSPLDAPWMPPRALETFARCF